MISQPSNINSDVLLNAEALTNSPPQVAAASLSVSNPPKNPFSHFAGPNVHERLNEYDSYLRGKMERNFATNTLMRLYFFKEKIEPDETEDFLASAGRLRSDGSKTTF